MAQLGAKPYGVLPLPPSCLWVLPESGAWGSRRAGEGADRFWRAGGDSLGTQVPSLVRSSAPQHYPSSPSGSRLELSFRGDRRACLA
ncbi:hypothetical protein J1605_012190 [Eschrichtius robustus]|uniref:Uncharacterized protein n=1 Tax=Eschrichtius robustus TaxID=9764 RepID=A0AB34GMD1_ESCRO|nr:hypothetical protein J1605_012190 [Eschrichtius robustus]